MDAPASFRAYPAVGSRPDSISFLVRGPGSQDTFDQLTGIMFLQKLCPLVDSHQTVY